LNIKRWLKELLENTDLKCVVYLIGNKIDLVDKDNKTREVSFEEANEFAKENKLTFYETSACTNKNINLVFQELMESKDIEIKLFILSKIEKNKPFNYFIL
jgi:GTPase SAR1 family protein